MSATNNTPQSSRPDYVTDEHLEYLDNLRESGATNMFGAGAYLREEFDIDRKTASNILAYQMKTFGEDTRQILCELIGSVLRHDNLL